MPITPTTLIAVSGLVRGSGLQIPAELTNAVSAIQNNPLIATCSSLAQSYTYGGITLPAIMTALPPSLQPLTQLQSTASGILTQAQAILPAATGGDPSAGIKSFMSVFNSTTAFGSASAEYSAALSQFGNKSFADLGINMSNFQDIISNGTTSISKSFGVLANKAATDAFGGLASVLDPNLLAKGQAMMKSSALAEGLQTVGGGLKNFGTLFDFTQPANMGPKNLVASLQKQGLADRNGINDLISEAGYDPMNLALVPDSVLTSVLDQVKGSDLDKIIKQTGANPYQTVRSAAGLLQANNLLPPQAMLALGIIDKGPAALKAMGTTLSNLGTSIDNFKMSDLMSGIQTKTLQYLGQIKQLIPTDVKAALAPILGSGGGLFGNPQMKDMIGSVAGIGHTANLTNATKGVTNLQNTPAGKQLELASTAYQDAVKAFIDANPGADEIAILADPTVAAAAAAVESAANSLNSAINSSASLSKMMTGINTSITASVTQLGKEVQNLAAAGLQLVDNLGSAIEQAFNKGYQTILAFGSRLHKMGRDIQNLGFNDFLPKMATSNVSGDAIQASLIEGRNVSRSTTAGQNTPVIADEKKEIQTASAESLTAIKTDFINADAQYKRTREAYYVARQRPNTPELNTAAQAFYQAQIDREEARGKLDIAARNANVSWGSLGVYESVRNNG